MDKYRVVGIREETSAEKAQREWFEKETLGSPDNLEEAARQVIGLVTGMITVFVGILAVTGNPIPAYLRVPFVRAAGCVTLALLWIALGAALGVVVPWHWTFNPAQPSSQASTFVKILQLKSKALTIAVGAFAAGLLILGVIVGYVLLTVT
jgi:hypothetical protein